MKYSTPFGLQKNTGFTLIELVVVIIILGILAVVAVPKFVDLREDAQLAKLKEIAGDLNSQVAQVNAYGMLPNHLDSTNNTININGTQYLIRIPNSGEGAFLHGQEICHILGFTNTTGHPSDDYPSDDGSVICKRENNEFSWIRLADMSREQCYVRYNTNSNSQLPRATLACQGNTSECICP